MNVPFFKQFRPDLLITSLLHNPWTYPLAFVFFFVFMVLVIAGIVERREPHGRPGRPRDRADDHRRGRDDGPVLRQRPRASSREYLDLARLPGAAELTIFCGAMTGASIGFLWYNAHPAEIFMGDVGSLSLGGAMGVVAVLIKQELLLVFIGGVFMWKACR